MPYLRLARPLVKLDFCLFLPIIVHSRELAPEQGLEGIGLFQSGLFSERERVMNRKQVAYILALLTIVWFGVFTASAHGQPAEQSAQQDIEKALSQKDAFKFADVSLSGFVSMLREKYGMNVVIDYRALREKEIDPDSPVSIKLKNVTVRSALELAIRPLGLSWTIYCEAIVISTPAAIQGMQFTKVYDITDLATDSDGAR